MKKNEQLGAVFSKCHSVCRTVVRYYINYTVVFMVIKGNKETCATVCPVGVSLIDFRSPSNGGEGNTVHFCAEVSSHRLSMPQVSHRVCAVHGAELAIEMVTSERGTLVCKHEEHLNSKSLYALTFEQI